MATVNKSPYISGGGTASVSSGTLFTTGADSYAILTIKIAMSGDAVTVGSATFGSSVANEIITPIYVPASTAVSVSGDDYEASWVIFTNQ